MRVAAGCSDSMEEWVDDSIQGLLWFIVEAAEVFLTETPVE
jgi:hypothetical protein